MNTPRKTNIYVATIAVIAMLAIAWLIFIGDASNVH